LTLTSSAVEEKLCYAPDYLETLLCIKTQKATRF